MNLNYRPTITIYRTLLLSILALLFLSATPLTAQPKVRGTLNNLTESRTSTAIFLSLHTPQGLEQFVLHRDTDYNTDYEHSAGELQLRGASRPRRGRGSNSPVAATKLGKRTLLFYTSSRTGLPAAASFILTERNGTLTPSDLRLSKARTKSVPCGNGELQQAQSARTNVTPASLNLLGGDSAPTPFIPPRILEVATDADAEFSQRFPDTNGYIRAVLHATEVLYTSPLGVRLKIVRQSVASPSSAQSAPIAATALLELFRQRTLASKLNADIHHLFTDRAVTGSTIGIAYVGSACYAYGRFNIGLSRAVPTALQPILAAHEIGHNLGALHDSELHSIMNPAISSAHDHFSTTALASMHTFVAKPTSCIKPGRLNRAQLSLADTSETSFSATISLSSALDERCEVQLMAVPLLNGIRSGNFKTIVSAPLSTTPNYRGSQLSFTTLAPIAPTKKQQLLFKLKLTCPSGTVSSQNEILTIQNIGELSSDAPNGSAWLTQLRRNFLR